MDNPRFGYSPIVIRPPLHWPGGARLALWVVVNIEWFHYGVPGISINEKSTAYPPDVSNYAWREYGARVGVWRLMECLDPWNIRATVALNAGVCRHRKAIVDACVDRNWELMGHNMSNTRLVPQITAELGEDGERRFIAECLDLIYETSGQRPQGWLGSALAESEHTPDLLAEAGLSYLADWVADDQPFYLQTKSGPLVNVPYSLDINDIQLFLGKGFSGPEYVRIMQDQFDTLYRESERGGRVMIIPLHPFVLGQAYRIRYLGEALQYILGHEGVWPATGGEIARAYRDQVPPPEMRT